MSALPAFPPVYAPEPVGPLADPFARACAAARHGAPDGALYWSRREDRMDCAIVLRPEGPAADALAVALVAMVALADALSTLAAPGVAVQLAWPGRLLVNGAAAGALRADWDEGWIALGLGVAVMLDPDADPGRQPDRTTLHDEGCGAIAATGLLESFCRHFLYWVGRWQEEGFAPVRSAWLARAGGRGARVEADPAGGAERGRLAGLDDRGDLLLDTAEGRRALSLAAALKVPDRAL